MHPIRGILLLDLIPGAPGAGLIPADVAERLGALAVLEYQATTTGQAHIYHGTLAPLADLALPGLRDWPVEIPGLQSGIPFQLMVKRVMPGVGQNLEPAPTDWRLDLILDRVAITIPGLRPAVRVEGSGVTAAHLIADTQRNGVRIVGGGVFRISSTAGSTDVRFIDRIDPFDPDGQNGPVFRLTFEPPHFFIGGSDIGLTVDRLTYDDSPTYTPPEIVAREHDASWRGISIKEATVYLPRNAPIIGDLSVGVRDVLLGSPAGLQGQIQIELGQTPVDPAVVSLFIDGQTTPLPVSGTGETRSVTMPAGTEGRFRVRAVLNSGATAQWELPDGRVETANATSVFQVQAGETLRVRGREVVDAVARLSPTTTFRFIEAVAANPPQITATDGSTMWTNVLSVSGTAADLRGLTFATSPSRTDITWQLGEGGNAASGSGATFQPAIPDDPGRYSLVMRDANGKPRRVEVEVLAQGALLLGTEAGVRDRSGPVNVRAVEGTYEAAAFHQGGDRVSAASAATVSGGAVTVPAGTLAAVTVERVTTPQGGDAPADPRQDDLPLRQVQVLMRFDRTEITGWGPKRPGAATGFALADLTHWMGQFPNTTQFVMVGRTDDIGTLAYNDRLSQDRATAVYNQLPADLQARTQRRGEQQAGLAGEASIDYAEEANHQGRLIDHPEWDERPDDSVLPTNQNQDAAPRPIYRRVDIYALVAASGAPGQETQPNPDDQLPELRRVLVPGADGSSPVRVTPVERRTPYRVRLAVTWDSPTVVDLADAIPTQAELLVAWQATPVAVPTDGGPQNVDIDGPSIFQLLFRWSYDARSGETVLLFTIDNQGSPDGLFAFPKTPGTIGNLLAVAMGLGPALSAFLDAAGVDNAAARIGALIGASAVATPFARDGKVIVHKVAVEDRQRRIDSAEGIRLRALFDYTVQLGFEVAAGPIQIKANQPMKVKYRNVGMEFDDSRTGIEKLGLVYEDAAFEIVDPGQWQIQGPLGDLLRVVASRAGAGSTWMELDLAFALDLGVIRVTGATIRLTFDGGSIDVALRGLAASVKVPGAFEGSGALAVGQDGTISAGLDIDVIPAKVKARGDLDLNPAFGFVNLGIMVQFAVGLPLANTGLGVFGFAGRFVANGTRNFTTPSPDPIQQEINWWLQPIQKYRPERGQWALGIGAFVGTLPDAAFTFGALGMLVVEFPRPTVIFGIDAHFASPPSGGATENGGSSGNLLGLIVVDTTAVKIGIRGSYEIPKLVRIAIPVSAYFPFDRTQNAYLRIGCDGVASEGRYGEPVTIQILPGVLDIQAWAFLMIEEKKLHLLGGDNRFNFDGFSIGFGAGWGIHWEAGPIELSASAKFLVGVGTKPLMVVGGIFVEGRLHLVVIDISARGELILKLTESSSYLEGKFCGKVDLFFFSIEGCVGISVGSNNDPTIPTPASPLTGIDLTDRFGRVTGKAMPTGQATATVWPDTVPVLQFRQFMNPALSGSAFSPVPTTGIATPYKWAGTSELKYAFKLTGVEVRPKAGAALTGPLDAAWWLPSHRSGIMGDPDATTPAGEQEGRQLALMAWHPAPWASNLEDGGEGTEADPAEQLERTCEETRRPVPACVLGQEAKLEGPARPTMTRQLPAPGPFPSYFQVKGSEGLPGFAPDQLAALAAESGLAYVPGKVQPLPASFTFADGTTVQKVWEIGRFDQAGRPMITLPFEGKLAPELYAGEVTLSYCRPGGQQPPSREICQDYANLRLGTADYTFKVGDVTYTSLDKRVPGLSDVLGAGTPQLIVRRSGIRIDPAQVAVNVTVQVAPMSSKPVLLKAYDAAGALVAQAATTGAPRVLQTLTVSAANIDAVVVVQEEEGCLINRFCYTPAVAGGTGIMPNADFPLTHVLAAVAPKVPQVFGVLPDGKEVAWQPRPEKGAPDGCVFLTYRAPQAGPWVAFRIRPFQGVRLGLVRTCGITWVAYTTWQDEQATKDGLKDGVNSHSSTNAPDGRPLLDAKKEYEIVVRYKWAGWRKTDAQPSPPAVESLDWASRPELTEVYHFHTADWAAPTTDPVAFYEESRFDARMLARYIVKLEPDGSGAPHFLDDPIRVHWAVDYPDGLLDKYGRKLVLKVRRTDQKPGALHGADHPADEPILIAWDKLHFGKMTLADQRMRSAAEAAPCLDDPHLGGATASITAPLAPRAEYDLLVVAQSKTDVSDEVLIAVSHFRTSAYKNPGALLASVGLSTDLAHPDLIPPLDVLMTGAVTLPAIPAGTDIPTGDGLFEQALTSAGLNPWPLPKYGRTVALWRKVGATWSLAGLLVETDEPLDRTDRMALGNAVVGATTLKPAVANGATTRVFFVAAAPAAVADGASLRFDFKELQPQTGPVAPSPTTLSAALRMAGGPAILAQEGLL